MARMQAAAVVLAACVMVVAPRAAQAGDGLPTDDPVADAATQAHQAWISDAAAKLADDGGARQLALAALLLPGATGPDQRLPPEHVVPEAIDWARRASAGAGHDVVANRLLTAFKSGGDAATDEIRRRAAERWRAAEPDNLAPLLFAGLPPRELFAAATRTARFDLHHLEVVRWTWQAIAQHPPAPGLAAELASHGYRAGHVPVGADERALMLAIGLAAASWIPAQPLVDACSREATEADAGRRDACAHVAGVMRQASDTEFGTSVGRALARRLATPDELRALDAEARVGAWWALQFAIASEGEAARGMHAYFADPAVDTEQALAERVIADAGLSLVPPDGWDPRRAD